LIGEDKVKQAIFIALVVLMGFVLAKKSYFIDWIRQSNDKKVEDFLNPPKSLVRNALKTPAAEPSHAQAEASPIALGNYPALDLRDKLFAKDFDKLNAMLEGYQNYYAVDIASEDDMLDAYIVSFSTHGADDESLFNAWINHSPEHYQAYLARASYFFSLGWEARGGKWGEETSKEQLQAMERYFLLAIKDINAAFEKGSDNIVPYYLLINIYKAFDDKNTMASMAKKGLERFPYSFRIRSSYMLGITPRWNGSYQEMEAFANESQSFASNNPKIKLLKGYAFYDAGDMEYNQKNYGSALDLINNALSYGGHDIFYRLRALIYEQLNRLDDALQDINAAIAAHPQVAELYYKRARMLKAQNLWEAAASDLEIYDRFKPKDSKSLSLRAEISSSLVYSGHAKHSAKNYNEALKDYGAALRADPSNASVYYRRASVYIDMKDLSSAQTDLEAAIGLAPNNFDYYKLMDWLLMQHADWSEIIRYWTEYLSRNPSDDKAYFERGGAYFHKGDIAAAVADAKIAAELGNAEGQKVYERYKNQIPQ
jgi:tetratricopeptide (TPR) repeat protein